MSTELESAIRDALLSRVAAIVPHETDLRRPGRGRRWLPPALAAVAVVLVAVAASVVAAIRSHDSSGPAASPMASAVGYRWRLTAVVDKYGRLTVPAALRATVAFGPDGSIGADDTVNGYSGDYRLTGHGYEVTTDLFSTAVGFVGPATSARGRVIAAIGSVLPRAVEVPASVAGHTLTLHGTNSSVLTLTRDGLARNPSPASPTPTATN